MSEFIEVVEGFAINKEEIVSVKQIGEELILIETESREYTVPASFRMFLDALGDTDRRQRNLDMMSNQFFGG
jgi:hypothetical protein